MTPQDLLLKYATESDPIRKLLKDKEFQRWLHKYGWYQLTEVTSTTT